MPIVKMDEKGRIQIPHEVRDAWHLRPKQPVLIEMKQDVVVMRKTKTLDPETDPLLRDILIKPGHSKVRVTKALLRKLEDECWTP